MNDSSSPAEGRRSSAPSGAAGVRPQGGSSPARSAGAILIKLKPVVFALCLVPAAQIGWNLYRVISGTAELTDLGANPINKVEILTGLWTLRFLAITLAVTPTREIFGVGALAK